MTRRWWKRRLAPGQEPRSEDRYRYERVGGEDALNGFGGSAIVALSSR